MFDGRLGLSRSSESDFDLVIIGFCGLSRKRELTENCFLKKQLFRIIWNNITAMANYLFA